MVLLTYCFPCRRGDHDHHHEVMQAVPEGMMGGVKCRCEGECRSRSRACPCCEGKGCSECSGTGQKVTTNLDAGDGITMHVSGNAPLDAKTQEALKEIARLAARQMDAAASDEEADRG